MTKFLTSVQRILECLYIFDLNFSLLAKSGHFMQAELLSDKTKSVFPLNWQNQVGLPIMVHLHLKWENQVGFLT